MSAPGSLERELIAFAGVVECHAGFGTINLKLSAGERGARQSEVLFVGASTVALPERLHEVRVLESLDEGGTRRYRIESAEAHVFTLTARAVQLHRPCADSFFAHLPRVRVPWVQRSLWTVLLTLLRVPPVAAWLAKRSES